MKIKNISEKIIGIGSNYILPDAFAEVTEEEYKRYSVDVFVNLGLISVDGFDAKAQDKAAFDAAVLEAAKKMAAEMVAGKNTEEAAPKSEDEVVSSDGTTVSEVETESGETEAVPTPKRTRSKK